MDFYCRTLCPDRRFRVPEGAFHIRNTLRLWYQRRNARYLTLEYAAGPSVTSNRSLTTRFSI